MEVKQVIFLAIVSLQFFWNGFEIIGADICPEKSVADQGLIILQFRQ